MLYYRIKGMRDELDEMQKLDPRTMTQEQWDRAVELEDQLIHVGLALRALGLV